MNINIGLSDDNRSAVVELLNKLLADFHTMYVQYRNYHWNVKRSRFISLHELFENQYNQISDEIDEIAERITTLGGTAIGTLKEFVEHRRIEELQGAPDANQMLINLVNTQEAIIRNLRNDIEYAENRNDVGTEDFLTGMLAAHEKMTWMLRSSVED